MPRRSTGCEKCRQRKVKCDEIKPSCNRCTAYGVQCPGYRPSAAKDIHFVDQTQHVSRRSTSASGSSHPASQQAEWQPSFPSEVTSLPSLHQRMPYGDRAAVLAAFFDVYSPVQRDRALTADFPYLEQPPRIESSSSLLQSAVNWLCVLQILPLFMEDVKGNETPVQYAQVLPSLAEAAKQMGQSGAPQADQTAAALAICVFSELFDDWSLSKHRGSDAILSHGPLTQNLLLLYGRNALDVRLAWWYLQQIRRCTAVLGMAKRRAPFFAASHWRTVTAPTAAQQDPEVHLVDIVIRLPGLLERVDTLQTSFAVIEAPDALAREVRWLRKELDDWLYWRHVVSEQIPYREVDLTTMASVSGFAMAPPLFRTVFRFASLELCSQYQLYWVASLVLNVTLLDLCARCHLALSEYVESGEKDLRRNTFIAATNFCRSLPFCCESTTARPTEALLLTTVQEYFTRFGHIAEGEFCNLARPTVNSGLALAPVAAVLQGLQREQQQENEQADRPAQQPQSHVQQLQPQPHQDLLYASASNEILGGPDATTSQYMAEPFQQLFFGDIQFPPQLARSGSNTTTASLFADEVSMPADFNLGNSYGTEALWASLPTTTAGQYGG